MINQYQFNKLLLVFDELVNEIKSRFGWIPFEGDKNQPKSLFIACALCHNINWEFLCKRVVPYLTEDIAFGEFQHLFHDYNKPWKVKAEERYKMFKSLKYKDLTKLKSVKKILNALSKMPVFKDDPVGKKRNLYAQLLIRAGLIQVNDEYELGPAIDYHLIRVYLRTGRVIGYNQVELDHMTEEQITKLRNEISQGMKEFCKTNKKSIAWLGLIDWAVGRNYCDPEQPKCNECPIAGICEQEKLVEPESKSNFY